MSAAALDAREVAPQLVGAASASSTDGSGLRNRSPPRVPDFEEEEDAESYVDQELPTDEERKWSRFVVFISGLDMLISFIILVVAFRFAYRDNGVSLYCLGIQAVSHFLSSVLLTVRFAGELSINSSLTSQSLIRKTKRVHLVREQILSECMGIVMLISAAALLFKAFRKIRFWHVWYLDYERKEMDKEAEWAAEFLAWYGFAVYLLQGVFRYFAASRLRRRMLWHAFVASVVSLLYLFVLGVAASYEKQEVEWAWKAEPIAAIGLSFVTLFEGVRIIILHLDDMDIRLKFDPRA